MNERKQINFTIVPDDTALRITLSLSTLTSMRCNLTGTPLTIVGIGSDTTVTCCSHGTSGPSTTR